MVLQYYCRKVLSWYCLGIICVKPLSDRTVVTIRLRLVEITLKYTLNHCVLLKGGSHFYGY